MLTKVRYSAIDMFFWTRHETLVFFIWSLLVTLLYKVAGLTFLHIPWAPMAIIGTAVAFIIGFQNNAAYGRIWEARMIWGGIVNTSRTWGMKVKDMVSSQQMLDPLPEQLEQNHIHTLVYRHIAWLTALRHTMRQPKKWEVMRTEKTNAEWQDKSNIPERCITVAEDIKPYLSNEEQDYVLSKSNRSAAVLFLQSTHIKELKNEGLLWEFSFLELENLLEEMFTLQGKSERIKNFPYPRQYASLSYYFVWIFIISLPFATIPEFTKIGTSLVDSFPSVAPYFVWVSIPFCSLLSWVFHTMERIGRVGENPFEGSPNDVPISTISRGIEIDLREMLGELTENIPAQFEEFHDIQM